MERIAKELIAYDGGRVYTSHRFFTNVCIFFIRIISGYYGAGPLVEKLKSLELSIRKFKS
jgi:hypothetical protein